MNPPPKTVRQPWWSADFCSPKDFVRHGLLILLAFGVVHFLGLREFTSFLNGTTGDLNVNPDNATLLGVVYVGFYLAAILLAPICFIAAALLALWERHQASRST